MGHLRAVMGWFEVVTGWFRPLWGDFGQLQGHFGPLRAVSGVLWGSLGAGGAGCCGPSWAAPPPANPGVVSVGSK